MSKRLLVRDQQGERERLLVGTMTVGRDTRCDISDADPLLSRRHAEFVCRPDSLVVRDLNSRNGIAVNGVKVQEAVLRPGDVVRIARLVMTYLGDVDAVRPPSSSSPTADAPPHARPLAPPAAGTALPLRAPDGRAAKAADSRSSTPITEKMPAAGWGASTFDGASPEDDRTEVVPRRSRQGTATPGQVAVARLTPSTPAQSPPPPAVDASVPEDSEPTRPMIHQGEARTDTPVLPVSAFRAATPVPGAAAPSPLPPPVEEGQALPPPVTPVPIAVPPLEDWSLELRPQPLEAPPAPTPVAPTPRSGQVLAATVGLAVMVFALSAVPMIVWMAYRPDVPAVLWNFVVVLGPSLLCSLAAGLGLAWWLRRTMRSG
jgi:hypothetical protein